MKNAKGMFDNMTAKEIFKFLGYEITTDDYDMLVYTYKEQNGLYLKIKFNLLDKVIQTYYNHEMMNCLNIDDIQAINKQINELGWLDEKI